MAKTFLYSRENVTVGYKRLIGSCGTARLLGNLMGFGEARGTSIDTVPELSILRQLQAFSFQIQNKKIPTTKNDSGLFIIFYLNDCLTSSLSFFLV